MTIHDRIRSTWPWWLPIYGIGNCADGDVAMTEFHPIQTHDVTQRGHAVMPSEVTLRAYEVYCDLYGAQPAMVDLAGRGCRGGFGVGELIAFLYARSFPKQEWQKRFDEAIRRPEPTP